VRKMRLVFCIYCFAYIVAAAAFQIEYGMTLGRIRPAIAKNLISISSQFSHMPARAQAVQRSARLARHRSISSISMSSLLVDCSYNLAIGSLIIGVIFGVIENNKGPAAKVFGAGALLFTIFAAFVAFQTTTLRFQFDDTNFSLVKLDGSKIDENVVVGGANSWRYDSFVNYAFLPAKQFPILVYFKETQTPSANRVEAPIVVDNAVGQPHFFPAIADAEQLEQQFIKHNCAKL
jgi:hypothetical protein